jgi:ribose-phosphate pyrophosphokinase
VLTRCACVYGHREGGEAGLPGLSMLIKQRSGASKIERMDLVGSEIKGRDVILVDDMVDTAGTLCAAALRCKEGGAKRVFAFCTHGLLSGPAPKRLAEACAAGHLESLIVTDSVPQRPLAEWNAACGDTPPPSIRILSVAPIIAESIKRLAMNDHISTMSLSKL